MLNRKKIILGVTGGIAAYKAPFIVRALRAEGAEVRVVLTDSARQFVSPLSLQVVSGFHVGTDLFDLEYEDQIGHIELARWADVVLIAPATANLVGKMVQGLSDDLLSTLLLATEAPIVLAPAMNSKMLSHTTVSENLVRLKERGNVTVVSPVVGELACKEVGMGRQADHGDLIDGILTAINPSPLSGLKVMVTAGATREWVDRVRFLSNPSTGRMGFAMARTARILGAEVIIIAGPTHLAAPTEVQSVSVETAGEMAEAVNEVIGSGIDIAVFTAAVADMTPSSMAKGKIRKRDLPEALLVERTEDILGEVVAGEKVPFCIGFAAEVSDFRENTIAKCKQKGCHLMIGNDVSGEMGFGSIDNQIILVDSKQVISQYGPASKMKCALSVWADIVRVYERE
jgi:phosphopantothenoylcysteine decarboxylase/phosphopantothenate--cysteine ligase